MTDTNTSELLAERMIVRALKPVLQRLAALEKNSHPPVDLLPIIKTEVADAIEALSPKVREPELLGTPLAEARHRLRLTEGCDICNADDERFWRRVIEFLQENPAWSTIPNVTNVVNVSNIAGATDATKVSEQVAGEAIDYAEIERAAESLLIRARDIFRSYDLGANNTNDRQLLRDCVAHISKAIGGPWSTIADPPIPEDADGPFEVSRTSNGERDWFSARDAAACVSIPAKDRGDAYNLCASLNRAIAMHVRVAALSSPPTLDRERVADELREHLEAAYRQGAHDVHEHWEPDPDPSFVEAASDYVSSLDLEAVVISLLPAEKGRT